MGLSDAYMWNIRYAKEKNIWNSYLPKQLLLDYEHLLPLGGLALDAACGLGGTGRYLSQKGLKVVSLDISSVGIRLAQKKYLETGLPFIGAIFDLSNPWLPGNHFDVILNFCFLERRVFKEYRKALKPGGLIFFETFVSAQGDRGHSEHYLDQGELFDAFEGFEIIHSNQIPSNSCKGRSKRKRDQLIARKPKC